MMFVVAPLLFFLASLPRLSAADAILPSAEVSRFLEEHGLPGGLLPNLVTSYSLRDNNSTFVVHLQHECYHRFENLVWYGTTISGKLGYGKIENLSGIQAKELFLWLGVTGIRVDESNRDYIYFEVGIVSKRLRASLFRDPPSCSKSSGSLVDLHEAI
ncbi:hypothetical protein SELMODRAFT_447102 [Selaginella moellendorffii]|uniref:Uncharacterized protein n=2 Tax=Selaginella moellendorffii TaxID=88036 RepID=D8SWR0_SELML|nr:uncharacterized protein LOC9651903 [Selaginella moellendorffii]XP_002994568.2 uncharacterized protein LOC9641167 [Selaginella moellendorffii]EFJ11066.1 hypothetical protein SELMODRAFT_447102 [Selaginella moellendorffii]|eukprot:XP_002987763.1 uncharacterized protein LOC9651903 [Selaginella moellendorffii]